MKNKKTVPPEDIALEEKIQRLNSELGLLDVSDVATDDALLAQSAADIDDLVEAGAFDISRLSEIQLN